MFGLMWKKTHERILLTLETRVNLSLSIKNETIGSMKKRKDELIALNADKMLQIEKLQNEITALNNRLASAVEGLSFDKIKVLRASMDGNYIYRVTTYSLNWEVIDVIVPKALTNFDGYAKREMIKRLGLPWKSYKDLTAKRLVL